jgi:transposase-like protein
MSVRLIHCPSCKSRNIEIVKLLNPDTIDMNCKADIKCLDCDNTWVGYTTSPRNKEMRRKGWVR